MTRQRLTPFLAALALAAAACGHERPADPGVVEPPPPLTGNPPIRLTFNPESDWNPVFARDGAGVMYSYAIPGRADRDRCLGLLPAAGGTLQGELCWRGPAEADSSDVVVLAAESPGGRLAFVVERGLPTAFAPNVRALLAGPPRDAEHATVLLSFPVSVSPILWHGAGDLTWLDDSTLVFVAQTYGYRRGSAGEQPDTLITGVEIARLDLRTDPPTPRVYGNTRYASSVAPGADPGTVILTAGGDPRVYTLNLASGTIGLLYDFGTLGIARDARLVNGRLLAVVGGKVTYGYDAAIGFEVQRDEGGAVYLVDLGGAAVPILMTPSAGTDSTLLFRHPAFSPDGTVAVAEGYRAALVPQPFGQVDTVVDGRADLYRIPVP